jgi:HEAT repeat protein
VIRDAGMVLGRIASTAENLRALLEFTRDRSASVRATIAYALGEATAGESSRLRALSELVGDTTSADVRDAAVSALVQVGGLDAKRVLETSLERERNNLVRTALADAIAELE